VFNFDIEELCLILCFAKNSVAVSALKRKPIDNPDGTYCNRNNDEAAHGNLFG